ncbi:hypothetical protein ABPG75_000264 [Micractinium tetrahymenae]
MSFVLRLRPCAAGLEAAVHCGTTQRDGEEHNCHVAAEGRLFCFPATAAGIRGFVSDLLCCSWWSWSTGAAGHMAILPLHLRETVTGQPGQISSWRTLSFSLFESRLIKLRPGPSPDRLTFRVPRLRNCCLAGRDVGNLAEHYFVRQHVLRSRAAQAAAAAGGAPVPGQFAAPMAPPQAQLGPLPLAGEQPDDDEAFHRRYRELSRESMASLEADLTAAIQHACRYRGSSTMAPTAA